DGWSQNMCWLRDFLAPTCATDKANKAHAQQRHRGGSGERHDGGGIQCHVVKLVKVGGLRPLDIGNIAEARSKVHGIPPVCGEVVAQIGHYSVPSVEGVEMDISRPNVVQKVQVDCVEREQRRAVGGQRHYAINRIVEQRGRVEV